MVNRHAALPSNLDDLNNIEETAKTKFTMEIANKEKDLEFLDLRIKCVLEKILQCLCKVSLRCRAIYMLSF